MRPRDLTAAALLAPAITVLSVASLPSWFDVLAVTSVALSSLAVLAVAVSRDPGRAAPWIAALVVWVVTIRLAAHVMLPDRYLAPLVCGSAVFSFCCAAPFYGIGAAKVALALSRIADALVAGARSGIVVALAAITVACSGAYALTRSATAPATVDEQIRSLTASRVVPPMGTGLDERVQLGNGIELARDCNTGGVCGVRLVSEAHPDPRVPNLDRVGRGELAIAVRAGAIVVAPHDEDGAVSWTDGQAFDAASLERRALLVSDLPAPPAAPISWSWSACVAALAALVSWMLALRSLRRRRALAGYVEAIVDDTGLVHTRDGPARSDSILCAGPALVVVDRSLPSYRADGIGVVRAALPGTRDQHDAHLAHRATALALVAILVALAAVIPLHAAESEGFVALAPWAAL